MNITDFRLRYPVFTYHAYNADVREGRLDLSFRFSIAPDIEFSPQVSIPLQQSVDQSRLRNFAFHVGLIEAVSYWKSACSPRFVVEAGSLSGEQAAWWHDLLIHGMGEFFYRNTIDFTGEDFVHIVSSPSAPVLEPVRAGNLEGDLIMVGGGKDSTVTLELLRALSIRRGALMVNPAESATATAGIAGIVERIAVNRTIDPGLLELNRAGYLNGHTPFSAYLSFMSLLVAYLYGYNQVIVSNEFSAGEGNVEYHGITVNHQYSKSLRYEQAFREYASLYISPDVNYFSFLRPLSELQIAGLFAATNSYDHAFCSCNVGRSNRWCGRCAKCAFVYLSLSPFLDPGRTRSIFGPDEYFDTPEIQQYCLDLTGLGRHKPFECVGTVEESKMAIALAARKYRKHGLPVPPFLADMENRVGLPSDAVNAFAGEGITGSWHPVHYLPAEYESILKSKVSGIRL